MSGDIILTYVAHTLALGYLTVLAVHCVIAILVMKGK